MRDGLPERLVGVEGEEYIIGVFVRSCPVESLRYEVSGDRAVLTAGAGARRSHLNWTRLLLARVSGFARQILSIEGQLLGGHGASQSLDAPFVGLLAQKRPTEPRQAINKPVALTEAEAIRLAQAGDATAFEFLYQMHSRRVYALCLRMVGNPADAEDLMQEAFLQLFRKIGTFRGESAFSTWLHRMTVNVVLMRLRKKSLPAASLEETTEPDEETGGPRKDIGAPDLGLSGAVDRVNLERSIEKLPPGYRTVFVLHDVQGYEHNEIADIMGCSVGNSKSQLHKARTRLRELLQEDARDQARQERQEAKAQAPNQD